MFIKSVRGSVRGETQSEPERGRERIELCVVACCQTASTVAMC